MLENVFASSKKCTSLSKIDATLVMEKSIPSNLNQETRRCYQSNM